MATGEIGDLVGGSVYKCNIYLLSQLQSIQTGFYLRDTGLANQSAQDAADAVKDWVDDSFRTILATDITLQRVDALEITTKEYAQHEYTNTNGTFATTMTANFLAALIQLRSSQRARHRNGRMFWPIVNVNTNSQLHPGTSGPMATVLDEWKNRFMGNPATNAFKAVIVAQARPATAKRPAITHSWIDVETARLSNLGTALRRRKVGVGS